MSNIIINKSKPIIIILIGLYECSGYDIDNKIKKYLQLDDISGGIPVFESINMNDSHIIKSSSSLNFPYIDENVKDRLIERFCTNKKNTIDISVNRYYNLLETNYKKHTNSIDEINKDLNNLILNKKNIILKTTMSLLTNLLDQSLITDYNAILFYMHAPKETIARHCIDVITNNTNDNITINNIFELNSITDDIQNELANIIESDNMKNLDYIIICDDYTKYDTDDDDNDDDDLSTDFFSIITIKKDLAIGNNLSQFKDLNDKLHNTLDKLITYKLNFTTQEAYNISQKYPVSLYTSPGF